MANRAANLAVLQNAANQAMQFAQAIQAQRQREQEMELRKQQLADARQEQKARLSLLDLEKTKLERQQQNEQLFFNKLSDPSAPIRQTGPTGGSQFGAPTGSGETAQNQALLEGMQGADPRIQALQLASLAGRAGQQDTFELLANQGLIQTPLAQQEAIQRTADLQKTKQQTVTELTRQSKAIADTQKAQADTAKSIAQTEKIGVETQGVRQGNRLNQFKISDARRREQLIKTLSQNAPSDPKAAAALQAMSMGQDAKAIELMYPEFKSMTKAQLALSAVRGNKEAWETYQLLSEGNKGFTQSVVTHPDGTTETTFSTAGGNKISGTTAMKAAEELSQIELISGYMDRFEELVRSEPSSVGFFGKLSQVGSNLAAQMRGIRIDESSTKVQKLASLAFNESADVRSRAHAMGVLLGALGSRSVLGEVGVLTDRDVARGERIFGSSSRFFDFGSAPQTLSSLSEMRKSLSERESSIRRRFDIFNELAPSKDMGKTVFQSIGERHGWIPKAAAPVKSQPSSQKLSPIESMIKSAPSMDARSFQSQLLQLPKEERIKVLRRLSPAVRNRMKEELQGVTQ